MKIYFSGVEYWSYREIMKNLGVQYGCLKFSYTLRTPRFSIQSTSFLDELMVIPGELKEYEIDDYIEFLDNNREYISFALAAPGMDIQSNVLPQDFGSHYFIDAKDLAKPFSAKRHRQNAEKGAIIHGADIDLPFLSSMNTKSWTCGSWLVSDFVNGKMRLYNKNARAYSVSIARKLIKEGYKLDLVKIKKGDWQELAKMNCISWMKYAEVR